MWFTLQLKCWKSKYKTFNVVKIKIHAYSLLTRLISKLFEIDLISMAFVLRQRVVDNRWSVGTTFNDTEQTHLECHSMFSMQKNALPYARQDNLLIWCDLRLVYPALHQVCQVIWKPNQTVREEQHSFSSSHSLSLHGCNIDFRCNQHIHVRKL
jgi:hypothetical protein